MHVLVTSDTLTGVWTYTRELVTGLVTAGLEVTLISFGEIPLPQQTTWMESLHGLDYRPTAFPLEWMEEAQQGLEESSRYLESVIEEVQPDVAHLNQYAYGGLRTQIPRAVVAHGDMVSWWLTVHGHEPRETRWSRAYRERVARGIAEASALVAPSYWMLDTLRACYPRSRHERVIYSGRNPIFFNPYASKDDSVLSVGRLWDAGKQVSLLTQHVIPLSICIVGSHEPAYSPRAPIRADVKVATDQICVALKGPQTEAQLRNLYSRASIYAATSRYEPFGMELVEAALSRCAIVANDIPSFREIWGDAALYFQSNDADSLAATLRMLSNDRDLCLTHANLAYHRARERFSAHRMVDSYLALYRNLVGARSAAA